MLDLKRSFVLFSILTLVLFSGCSSLGTSRSTVTPELTPEETATEKTTESAIRKSSTPKKKTPHEAIQTKTEVDKYADRRQKYRQFDKEFRIWMTLGITAKVINTEIYPENESYHIQYEMENPRNRSISREERRLIALSYMHIVNRWNSADFPDRDHTYIPDTVNVTVLTPEGKLYETSYLKYNWAYQHSIGKWSKRLYLAHYAGSIELGPEHPDYEGRE